MKASWAIAAGATLCLCGPAAWADTDPPKPVSAYIQCDGRTGHVGIGATLGRLVLLTATAGLSEAATAKDDVSRRVDGAAGAEACQAAIAQEGNDERRMQLAFARAIHLIEADQLDDALAAAKAVDSIAGPLASEKGYQRTVMPRVLLLQAAILTRQKRPEKAEAAAIQALTAAPYDVALAKRAARYVNLTPALGKDKEAVLLQIARLMPELSYTHGSALVAAGRFADAEASMTAEEDVLHGFYPDAHPETGDATRALLFALMGDFDKSKTMADGVEASLTKLAPSGYAVQQASTVAVTSEMLNLAKILRQAGSGDASGARAAFRAHGPWLLTNKEIVLAAIAKLRAGAPASELTGPLDTPPETLRAQYQAQLLAALSDEKLLASEYDQPFFYAKASAFASASGATWKVGAKPRFLVKPGAKQLATTDVLDTLPAVDGLPASEAVMLQAALIAQSRGVDGFVLGGGRRYTGIVAMRCGKIGEPGMPALLAFNAQSVIADLSPDIPQPVQN